MPPLIPNYIVCFVSSLRSLIWKRANASIRGCLYLIFTHKQQSQLQLYDIACKNTLLQSKNKVCLKMDPLCWSALVCVHYISHKLLKKALLSLERLLWPPWLILFSLMRQSKHPTRGTFYCHDYLDFYKTLLHTKMSLGTLSLWLWNEGH